ncbi:MAG: hypothetical protein ACRD2L_17465 [Terriglobia bacterium]
MTNTIGAFLKQVGISRIKRVLAPTLAVLLMTTVGRTAQPDNLPGRLPLPSECEEIQEVLRQVQASDRIPVAGKIAYRQKSEEVEERFQELWQPLESSYERVVETTTTLKAEEADLNARIKEHNDRSGSVDTTSESAVNDYNQERDALSGEQHEFFERWDRTLEPLVDEMYANAGEVERWLKGPLQNFLKWSRQLTFGDSEALRQLKRIAAGENSPEFGNPGRRP